MRTLTRRHCMYTPHHTTRWVVDTMHSVVVPRPGTTPLVVFDYPVVRRGNVLVVPTPCVECGFVDPRRCRERAEDLAAALNRVYGV